MKQTRTQNRKQVDHDVAANYFAAAVELDKFNAESVLQHGRLEDDLKQAREKLFAQVNQAGIDSPTVLSVELEDSLVHLLVDPRNTDIKIVAFLDLPSGSPNES